MPAVNTPPSMNKNDYNDLRTDYGKGRIDDDFLLKNPFDRFILWMKDAVDSGIQDANAMALSTVSAEGKPSSRIVLLKEFNHEGLVFFTNFRSKKGRDIDGNPNVAVLFFWPELERQIRIEGFVNMLHPAESDEYFNSRPYQSRAAAVVSEQSSVIADRITLENNFNHLLSHEEVIERPQDWGGYRIIPESFEFWQGRPNRLHDRIRFRKENENWIAERLAP